MCIHIHIDWYHWYHWYPITCPIVRTECSDDVSYLLATSKKAAHWNACSKTVPLGALNNCRVTSAQGCFVLPLDPSRDQSQSSYCEMIWMCINCEWKWMEMDWIQMVDTTPCVTMAYLQVQVVALASDGAETVGSALCRTFCGCPDAGS